MLKSVTLSSIYIWPRNWSPEGPERLARCRTRVASGCNASQLLRFGHATPGCPVLLSV